MTETTVNPVPGRRPGVGVGSDGEETDGGQGTGVRWKEGEKTGSGQGSGRDSSKVGSEGVGVLRRRVRVRPVVRHGDGGVELAGVWTDREGRGGGVRI